MQHVWNNPEMRRKLQLEDLSERDLQGGRNVDGEDNIKMDLKEVGCDPGNRIDIAEDRDQWWTYVRAVINFRVP